MLALEMLIYAEQTPLFGLREPKISSCYTTFNKQKGLSATDYAFYF